MQCYLQHDQCSQPQLPLQVTEHVNPFSRLSLDLKIKKNDQSAMKTRSFLILVAFFTAHSVVLGASSLASAYTIYSAEQPQTCNEHWWNCHPWIIPFEEGEAAESAFISSLSTPLLTDTLDGLSIGSLTGQSLFGGLARITQSSIAAQFQDPEWCYNYSRCLERLPWTPNPLFRLRFSKAVNSFGFWANHQNNTNNRITVKINGGPVILGPSAKTGMSSFYGFIATSRSELITSLDFITSNEHQGYLYFDQFSTSAANPADSPGPVPAMATAMAFAWSRSLRRRIKSFKRVSDP
ncbi:MAG: hypothetical protein ACK550_03320 [Synechococcaceae cyanobacterium]|jgi:hypothetical protein